MEVIEFSGLLLFGLMFLYIGIGVLFRFFFRIDTDYRKVFVHFGIFISLLLIVSLTLFPIRVGVGFEEFEIYNYIPFKVPYDMYMNYSLAYFLYQVVGNIVLFVPLGYFTHMRIRSVSWTILICFIVTLSVEITQGFIPYRFCEIDDLWLNTLGGFIGVMASLVFNYTSKKEEIKSYR